MKTNKQSNNKPFSLREFGRRALTILLTISMVSMNTPLAYADELVDKGDSNPAASETNLETQGTSEEAESGQNQEPESNPEPEVDPEVKEQEGSESETTGTDQQTAEPVKESDRTPEVDIIDDATNEDSADVDVTLALNHAYIYCNDQVIASPTTTMTLSAGKEFKFAASSDQGYELDEVKVVNGDEQFLPEKDEQGLYIVPGQSVKEGIKLIVSAVGSDAEDVPTTTPIDQNRNEQDTFVYEDKEVRVTATLDDPSVLPAGVKFKVTAITPDSDNYNYNAYMEALNNKAKQDTTSDEEAIVYDEQNTLLYDVAFMDGDVEIKLEGGLVNFSFEFKKDQLASDYDEGRGDTIDILHLPLVESVRDSVDSTAEATGITASDVKVEGVIAPEVDPEDDNASFGLDGLSTTAFVLTKGNRSVAEPMSVTTQMHLYDTDGTTPYPIHNVNNTYYVRLRVKDKEGTEYYALKEFDIRDRSEASLTIDYVARLDEELEFGESPDSVALTTDFTLVTEKNPRVINDSKGEITNYEDAMAADDSTLPGYEFISNNQGADNTFDIVLKRKAHDKRYGVRLNFDTNAISVTENDRYAIFVKVTRQSGGQSWFYQRLNFNSGNLTALSDGTYAYDILIPRWRDQNNSETNDKFTGNERSIDAKLYVLYDNINLNEVIQGNKCAVITEGKSLKNYQVSYAPRIVEADTQTNTDTTFDVIKCTEIQATNDYNHLSILGGAVNYGITANHLTQANDLQTNFATNLFTNTGHSITPNLASAAGGFVMANAEWKDNRWVIDFGSPKDGQKIMLIWGEDKKPSEADGNTPLKDNGDWGFTTLVGMKSIDITNNIVNPMITYCSNKSDELSKKQATISTPGVQDKKSVLDVSGFASDATIYVDADDYINSIEVGQLRVIKHPDQTIVFNFKRNETVNINRIEIQYAGEGGSHSSAGDKNPGGINNTLNSDARHFVWNCKNATSVNISEGVGIFLVPRTDSTTTVNATSSGWIVTGGHFKNPNGEWHGIYNELPSVNNASLQAVKTVDGATAKGSQTFTFEVKRFSDGNWASIPNGTVENKGGAINVTVQTLSVGWNVYSITETGKAESTQGEYTFDQTTYYAAVKYEEKTLSGNSKYYVAHPAVYFKSFNQDAFDPNAANATAFMSEPVTYPTFRNTHNSSSLTIQKQVTNQPEARTNDTFEFEVTLRQGTNPVIGTYKGTVYTGESATGEGTDVVFNNRGKATVRLKANQRLVINDLSVNTQYLVKEIKPEDAAWNLDSATNATGTINTQTSAPVAVFENGYETTIEQETTAHVYASKSMKNGYWGSARSFDFTMTAQEEAAPMPEGSQTQDGKQVKTMTATKGSTNSAVDIDFGEMKYTQPGMYHYTIKENTENLPAYITADNSVWTATVNVDYNDKGILTATTTYAMDGDTQPDVTKAVFTNEYVVNGEVNVSFKAQKSLEGKTLTEGAYSFVLQNQQGTPSLRQVKTNDATNGNASTAEVNFDPITYRIGDLMRWNADTGLKYDTFSYTITEQQLPAQNDVLYDNSTYIVEVTVRDKGDGKLEATEPVYKKGDQTLTEVPTFVNKRLTNSVTFSGSKTISGRSFQKGDSYTFTVDATEVLANGTERAISSDSNLVPGDKTITPESGQVTEFTFDPINYTLADAGHTYRYTVHEKVPDDATEVNGKEVKDCVTYDGTEYVITVSVALVDGQLQVTTIGNPTALNFTNSYVSEGSIDLHAQKTLNDGNPGNATYEFQIWRAGHEFKDGKHIFPKTSDEPVATVQNDGESITFSGDYLHFTQEDLAVKDENGIVTGYQPSKMFYYVVAEKAQADDGFTTYDTSEKAYAVKVSSNGTDGALTVELEPNQSSTDTTFKNKKVNGASVVLKVRKTVNGANLADLESTKPFSFTLSEVVDGKDVSEQTKTTNQGFVTFDTITYTKNDIGLHQYQIKENADERDYITFDSHTEIVYVNVVQNGNDLVAAITDKDGKPLTIDGQEVVSPFTVEFVNNYKATDVDVELSAEKSLKYLTTTGAEKAFNDGDFSFELSGPKIEGATTASTNDGVATFDKISFSMDDLKKDDGTYADEKSFVYTITEVIPSNATNADGTKYKDAVDDQRFGTFTDDKGVTYNGVPQQVTVKLTDNHEGHLTVTYDGTATLDPPVFTNTYDAAGVYELEATKLLDGQSYEGEQFSFSLYEGTKATGTPIQTVSEVGQGGKVTFTLPKFTLDQLKNADGTITDKTFDYTIVENNTGSPHYNYDTVAKNARLKVSDKGDGTLAFELTEDSDDLTFTNSTRKVADGEVTFAVQKTLNDNPSDRAFDFVLEQKDADGTYNQIDKATSATEGEHKGVASFHKITYNLDQVGDYEYRIHESVPEGATPIEGQQDKYLFEGITYDGKNVDITVHVTDNKDTNKLDVTYTVAGQDSNALPTITFSNEYHAEDDLTINAQKTIVGREFHGEDTNEGLQADSMTFTVSGVEVDAVGKTITGTQVPMPEQTSVTITPTRGTTAQINFGKISYTEQNGGKNYRYTVTESINSGDGVSIREQTHYVDVVVTDDGKGTLSATPTYHNGDQIGQLLDFVNDYTAQGSVELSGTKTVEGRPMDVDNDVFTFNVVEYIGEVATGRSWTATNKDSKTDKATSTIDFKDIDYALMDKGKTFRYVVSEDVDDSNDNNGVTLQTPSEPYSFTVEVTDKGDGSLAAKVEGQDPKALNFVNKYTAQNVEYTFAGAKILTGRAMSDGDIFTFDIVEQVAEGEKPTWTATNADLVTGKATEAIQFPTFTFTKGDEGEHTYVISEQAQPQNSPITVRTGPYTVKLRVYDDMKGNMRVAEEEGLPKALNFRNEYTATQTVTFGGKKKIEGRQFKSGDEFTFEVISAGGKDAQGNDLTNERIPTPTAVTINPTSGTEQAFEFTTEFNQDCVGNTYTYTFHEKNDGLKDDGTTADTNGVTYDATTYQVQFTVQKDNGDGTLTVVGPTYYAGGTNLSDEAPQSIDADAVVFTNTYAPESIEVQLEARKELTTLTNITGQDAPMLERGAHTFQLLNASGEPLQTVTNGTYLEDNATTNIDPSMVRFAPIGYSRATANAGDQFMIVEVPDADAVNAVGVRYADATAEQKAAGGFTLNGVSYDETKHSVNVKVYDDQAGKLYASVVYDNHKNDLEDGTNPAPTFTNTLFKAQTHVEFNKYYYGANDVAFTFNMVPTDAQFQPLSGVQGVKLSYGNFQNGVAKVTSETMTYTEPGTYRYVIYESPVDGSSKVSTDTAQILVTVTVTEKAEASVSYAMRYTSDSEPVAVDQPALYNNGMVSMKFKSAALKAMGAMERSTSFEPMVQKVLKSGVLKGGDFEFSLYKGKDTTGELLETVPNDVNGRIKFKPLYFNASDIGQTYEYVITERNGGDSAIIYDEHAIKLTITVKEQEPNGALVAEATYEDYDDEKGTYVQTTTPSFVNTYDHIVIHTVKRSREEPYDPLPGAHYGLWMVNPDGENVYMGLGRNQAQVEGSELVSSDNGDLYYDIPMLEGVAYYFLEEWPPPAGHLVDPYPTDLFTLVHDEDGTFRLVYELDPDFSTYCPGITYDMAKGGKA